MIFNVLEAGRIFKVLEAGSDKSLAIAQKRFEKLLAEERQRGWCLKAGTMEWYSADRTPLLGNEVSRYMIRGAISKEGNEGE